MNAQLIDRIYESCFAPETWPDVLDEIGRIGGTTGASLIVSRNNVLHWVASPEPRERAKRIVKEGWLWRGHDRCEFVRTAHAGFLIDVEYFTPEELDREPIYREALASRRGRVGHGAPRSRFRPAKTRPSFCRGGRNAVLSNARPANRLDELRPHLARSVLISARLQLERARVAGDALAALGVPALVLKRDRQGLGRQRR